MFKLLTLFMEWEVSGSELALSINCPILQSTNVLRHSFQSLTRKKKQVYDLNIETCSLVLSHIVAFHMCIHSYTHMYR